MVRSEEALLLEFHVDGKNQLVLQQAPLLGIPGVYTVQEAGSGCVYVQVSEGHQGYGPVESKGILPVTSMGAGFSTKPGVNYNSFTP